MKNEHLFRLSKVADTVFHNRVSYYEKKNIEIKNYILSTFLNLKEIIKDGGIFLIASEENAEKIGLLIAKSMIFNEHDYWNLIEVNLQNGVTSNDFMKI